MKKQLAVVLYFSIFLSGCIKDLKSPEKVVFTGTPQLPLLYSEITFLDLKKPSDSSLTFTVNAEQGFYEMNVGPVSKDFKEAGELINLANVSLTNVNNFPIANGPANLPVINYNIPVDVAGSNSLITGSSIQDILLSGGDLALQMTSNVDRTLIISLTMTGVVNISDNSPLILNYQLAQNIAQNRSQNLSGYKLVFNGGNTIGIKIGITVNNPASSPTSGTLSINSFSLNSLKWSRINGKMGNTSIQLGSNDIDVSSLGINAFSSSDNNTGTGVVFFSNPSLSIDFISSFGVKSQLILKPLTSLNKDSVLLKDVTNAPANQPYLIEAADDANTPKTTSHEIPKILLDTLLYKGPKYIKYGLVLSFSGANTQSSDFILSTSKIKTNSKLKLPLEGYLKGFKINSIIKAPDFSTFNSSASGDNFSLDVNNASVHFDFENKFPLVIATKVEFLDADSIPIPSVSSNITIGGANIDNQGDVISSKFTSNTLSLNKQQFSDLKTQCKSIRITGFFDSEGAPKNIRIYPTNKLNIQISVLANATGEYDLTK